MAKLPPKKEESNAQEWLNTYADMVTLLLTFFVLLFACSNLDETKLQYVFQEFKSRGKYINNVVKDQDPSAENQGGVSDNADNKGGEGTMPQSFEELYVYLAEYIDNNNLSNNISVEQGAAHITIRFDDSVFFDGDSAFLKPEGKAVLDNFIPAIRAIRSSIQKCTVSGHTSVGNSVVNDWNLSALRAVSVVNYIEPSNMLDPSKYRVMGCGPYEPVSDEPAKNRRVEMMFLKNELDLTDPDVVKDILEHDFGIGSSSFDPNNHTPQDPSTLPPGSVDKIVSTIKDKFNSDGVSTVGKYGPTEVDGNRFIPKDDSSGSTSNATGGSTAEAADQSATS